MWNRRAAALTGPVRLSTPMARLRTAAMTCGAALPGGKWGWWRRRRPRSGVRGGATSGPDRLRGLTCCHQRFLVILRMALGARAFSWGTDCERGMGLRRDADG